MALDQAGRRAEGIMPLPASAREGSVGKDVGGSAVGGGGAKLPTTEIDVSMHAPDAGRVNRDSGSANTNMGSASEPTYDIVTAIERPVASAPVAFPDNSGRLVGGAGPEQRRPSGDWLAQRSSWQHTASDPRPRRPRAGFSADAGSACCSLQRSPGLRHRRRGPAGSGRRHRRRGVLSPSTAPSRALSSHPETAPSETGIDQNGRAARVRTGIARQTTRQTVLRM